MLISKAGLMVGAPGGQRQISFMNTSGVDALLTGEIHEWETSEYVRDANAMGKPLALIVLGHQPSEEAGMAWLASWLEAPSDKCRSRTFRPEAHFTIKSEDN